MNCMSIEHGEHRLLIDCGITFPDHPFGTDVIRPDFKHLRDTPKRHTTLWITHGHEDHIGAVPYVLKKFNVHLYASHFTMGLIESKLE